MGGPIPERLSRNDQGYGLPVLTYHAVHQERSLISISPETFSKQMEWLYRQGYQTITLTNLIEYQRNGKKFPNDVIVLTFDDGYASLFTHVFPKLVKYCFTATIFLVSGHCGRQNDWPGQLANVPRMPLLTWDQIREMDEYGIEIGAHTINHPMLDQLGYSEIVNEVLGSKEYIETQLKHTISSFAYPYGRYSEIVKGVVKNEFSVACSSKVGLVNLSSDPFEIERVDINYIKDHWMFRNLNNKYFPYYLSIRRSIRGIFKVLLKRSWW